MRRTHGLADDQCALYFAWESLPEGWLEERGVEQVLLDAFDPIRRPGEKIRSLDWHGSPALRLEVPADSTLGSPPQIIGLAVVAGQHRLVAIALARPPVVTPQLMEAFVKSLRP